MVVWGQNYLNEKYPTLEAKQKVIFLTDVRARLKGPLDLTGFTNLQKLTLYDDETSSLNLTDCPHLTELSLRSMRNLSKKLDLSNNRELTYLGLDDKTFANILHLTKLTTCNTNHPLIKFQHYLLTNPDQQANLTHWPQFIECLRVKSWKSWRLNILPTLELLQQEDDWEKYWTILRIYLAEKANAKSYHGKIEEGMINKAHSIFTKLWTNSKDYQQLAKEFATIRKEKQDLDNKLATHDQTLTQSRQQLEQLQAEVEKLTRVNKRLKSEQEIFKEAREKSFQEHLEQVSRLHTHANDLVIKSYDKQKALKEQISAKEVELIKLQETQQAKLASKETALTQLQTKLKTLRESIKTKEQELSKLREETSASTASLRKEINSLKTELNTTQLEKNNLESQVINKDNKIANLEREILCLKDQIETFKSQLQSLQTENQTKDTKLIELNNQLIALAISSGELTKQCEELSNKLSISEQENYHKQLKIQIEEELSKQKDNFLSEQAQQIKDYELLLRKNDKNLANCQKIINEKSEQLEKLEGEKNNLAELLEQSEEKIFQLEDSLLNSQTRINELESQIKDLEQKDDNSEESQQASAKQLTKLRQELATLKNNSQKEINSLKNQLQQAKLQETQLAQKIKDLSTKKEKTAIVEEIIENSWWDKIKTPLLAIGGILAIIMIVNYFKGEK